MSVFIVEYGYGPQEHLVASAEEFDRVWWQADAEARSHGVGYWVIVYTSAELAGPTIAIGAGRDYSWLRTDHGDAAGELDPGDATLWAYGNQSGTIPPGRGIPNENARRAVHHFIETDGTLPKGITWIGG